MDCTGVLSPQPSGCLDLPALLRSTAGASRHQGYKHNLVSKAVSLRKWEGRERPCHRLVDSSLRLSFSHHPSHFLRDKTLETRLLETNPRGSLRVHYKVKYKTLISGPGLVSASVEVSVYTGIQVGPFVN